MTALVMTACGAGEPVSQTALPAPTADIDAVVDAVLQEVEARLPQPAPTIDVEVVEAGILARLEDRLAAVEPAALSRLVDEVVAERLADQDVLVPVVQAEVEAAGLLGTDLETALVDVYRQANPSVVFIVVSILCGQILVRLPFPTGYQIVFALGFLGAALSTVHLWFLSPPASRRMQPRSGRGLGDLAWPGSPRLVVEGLRPGIALRFLIRPRKVRLPASEILRGPFARLVAVFFAFYLALYLSIPLFPIRWVNHLHLSDKEIGWGTAVFYVSVFVGSTQLERLVRRLGNRRVTAMGAMLMGFYPLFMAMAQGLDLFLVGSVLGGLGWALVGGALTNYVLEKAPPDHRPGNLAWYNLALNAALLLGSLIGPVVAGWVGVGVALALFASFRFLAALVIWWYE